VYELDDITRSDANLARLGRLCVRIEVEAHMVDAASRGTDDRVELFEATYEESLRRGSVVLAAAVRHGLTTASLVERVLDGTTELLEKLESRDAHLGEERVDGTWNEEPHSHRTPLPPETY
jgi:hypothetical protein